MKLSAKGRYAIRAMINIALNDTNTPKTLLEISKHQEKNAMMTGMSPIIFKRLHMQKCLKNELELKSIRL